MSDSEAAAERRVRLHGGDRDGWVIDVPAVWGGDGYPPLIVATPVTIDDAGRARPQGHSPGFYERRPITLGTLDDYDWHDAEDRQGRPRDRLQTPSPSPAADPEDMSCPNCVTPWKCNGPHVPVSPTDGEDR